MEFPTTFEPQRSDRAPEWFRWASIGCGLVVIMLVGVLVVGLFRAQRFVDWGLSRLTNRVLQSLPRSIPDSVRRELGNKLACALAAARDGRVPPARIGELARACTDALADQQIAVEELERLDALAGAICHEGGGRVGK